MRRIVLPAVLSAAMLIPAAATADPQLSYNCYSPPQSTTPINCYDWKTSPVLLSWSYDPGTAQPVSSDTCRPQSITSKGRMAKGLKEKAWPLLEAGKIKPIIYKTFPLTEAAAAHAELERADHVGKVMLASLAAVVWQPWIAMYFVTGKF